MAIVITDQSGLLDRPYINVLQAQAQAALAVIQPHMPDWAPTWTINLTAGAPAGKGMIASTTNDGYVPTGQTAHGAPVYAPGTADFTTTIYLANFLPAGFTLSSVAPEADRLDTVGMLVHEIARGLGVASALTSDGGLVAPFVSTYDARVAVLPGLGAYFHASDGEIFALAAIALAGTGISTTLTRNEILSVSTDRGAALQLSHEDQVILADTNPLFHLIGVTADFA